MKVLYLILLWSSLYLSGMSSDNRQLLLCPTRKATVQAQVPQSLKTCVFCDPEILAKNYIIYENEENDVRIMMNKFPYFDFDQGYHLLIMPISHKLSFDEFSTEGLAEQLNIAQYIDAQLYHDAYSQGYFINLGEGGGQSVPHVHSHIQAFMEKPMSLPEMMKHKESSTNNIEYAFASVQSKLDSLENASVTCRESLCTQEDCYVCSMIDGEKKDEDKNFVVFRGKYNLVCIAHFPQIAAHIVVIPYNHSHTLKDLTSQEFLENIQLSLFLLPALKEYTQKNIRQWTGHNIFIKSLSALSLQQDKNNHHIYTSILPRTTISSPSATICQHACKLDFDAPNLFIYLKEYMKNYRTT